MNRLIKPVRAFWTVAVLMTSLASGSAFGDWWIVRSSDETCLVVDIEPTSAKGVTKIGKDKYGSAQEAEADVKRLCGGDGSFGGKD